MKNAIGSTIILIFTTGSILTMARNEGKLCTLRKELEMQYHIKVFVFAIDLAQKEAVHGVFKYTPKNKIFVDTLINNVGFDDYGKFVEVDLQKWIDMVNVNVSALL